MVARSRQREPITAEMREEAIAKCRRLIENGASATSAARQVSEMMQPDGPSQSSVYRWTLAELGRESFAELSNGNGADPSIGELEADEPGSETSEEAGIEEAAEESEIEFVDLEEYAAEVRAPLLKELAAKDEEIRALRDAVAAVSTPDTARLAEENAVLRDAVAALKRLTDFYMPH